MNVAGKIELEKGSFRITISYEGTIESPELYRYIQGLSTHKEKTAALEQAIKIGGHALNSNVVANLLNEIERSLGEQLSPIRLLVEKRATAEAGSQSKGAIVEKTIAERLLEFSKVLNFNDSIENVGEGGDEDGIEGKSSRKFGDVLVTIANTELRLIFESKANQKVTLGELTDSVLKLENARGQTRGSQANRNSPYAVFVTERGSSVHKAMKADLLVSQKDMAIFVMIDRQEGDYSNLQLGYVIGRALTLSLEWPIVQQQHLRTVAALIEKSLSKVRGLSDTIKGISKSAEQIKASSDLLLRDFSEELERVDKAMEYLEKVGSSNPSDFVELKLLELELLTGEKFSSKAKKIQ